MEPGYMNGTADYCEEVERIYHRRRKFVAIIDAILARGEFPSGARIQAELGRNHSALNSEQTRWRREHLESLGWTRGPNLRDRWKAPT